VSEQPGQGDGGNVLRQDTGRTPGDDTAHGGPAGPPPPGRPPVNAPEERNGWRALWLGVGALVLAWPMFPVGVVLGVASLVVGAKAQRRARRRNVLAPGATPGMVLGAVGLAMAAAAAAMAVVIGPETTGYNKCMQTANTKIDEEACRDRYLPKIEEKLHLPEGSLSGAVLP